MTPPKQTYPRPGYAMFEPRCPVCDSRDWTSWKRDEHGVNQEIRCTNCGAIRGRKKVN